VLLIAELYHFNELPITSISATIALPQNICVSLTVGTVGITTPDVSGDPFNQFDVDSNKLKLFKNLSLG